MNHLYLKSVLIELSTTQEDRYGIYYVGLIFGGRHRDGGSF
jgi:hypothetical protein